MQQLVSAISMIGKTLSLGIPVTLEPGIQLIKHSCTGSDLVIMPTTSLEDKSDDPLYVKDLLVETNEKFRFRKRVDSFCVLLVLSLVQNWRKIADVAESITQDWEMSPTLINISLSGPVDLSNIDAVYEMGFDFSWEAWSMGLAQCYPSRSDRNLCHPRDIFGDYRKYRNMLLSYFYRL